MNSDKKSYIVVDENNNKHLFTNPLHEHVEYNNNECSFQFGVDEEGFKYILYNNKRHYIEVLEKNQNKYVILVNGIAYTLSVESSLSLRRKEILSKQNSHQTKIQIKAPMPGLIVDILVHEGDTISQADSLLILEAMKMQNEIVSGHSGVIKKIHVKQNDIVMKDDILIEIEIEPQS